MEHACHQCGAAMEDGVPFCPQCGAPQIRVAPVEEAPATPPLPPGTPADAQPPAVPVYGAPPSAPGVDWSQALPAAALAGVVLAVAWIIPFLSFLFWMVGGGLLAVMFYRRRVPSAVLTPGLGARIGVLSGLFGFAFFAALFAVEMLLARGSGKFRDMMQQVMQQAAARNPDPRAQEMMQQFMTPAGMAALVTIVLVILLIGFLLLSSLGGALGAWLFRERKTQ